MLRFIFISFIFFLFTSCQEVVDVDLPEEDPRLILEALLRYNADDLQENRIIARTTGSFFGEIQADTLNSIQVLDETSGGVGFYTEDPDNFGEYVPGTNEGGPFDPPQDLVSGPGEPDNRLVLTFEYLDELYLAITQYVPVPDFINVVQGENTLFDNDETEIISSFIDPEEERNFYVFGYGNGEYVAIEDEFFNGQEYSFSYFSGQNLAPGDELTVRMWGVDEQFYNYMLQLIEQSELGENTLFQVPVSTVRGNILKVEDIDNIDLFDNVGRPQEFVLGYFAYIGERTRTLIIE